MASLPAPQKKSSKSLRNRAILTVICIIFGAFASLGGYGYLKIHETRKFLPKNIEIPQGAGVNKIAQILQAEGVIAQPFWFKVAAKIYGAEKNIKAGVYEIPNNNSIVSILKLLQKGKVVQYYFTLPEGLTVAETLYMLNNSPYIKKRSKMNIPEGSLLPETYAYTNGESTAEIIGRMQKAMNRVLDEAWENRDSGLPLKNKQEMLILASIVEKETALAKERQEIAGVFINRLKKGMKLQTDPTVIYGASNYKGDITSKHLKENHPYNTYIHKGLPPTPIANPGKASIMAVAHPNVTSNLFFVADGEGGHAFAKSHSEHRKNVRNYLKKMRNR